MHDLIDEKRENDRKEQNLVVLLMENKDECHALDQDQKHYVESMDKGHEKMMEELKQSMIDLMMKITLDDHRDLQMQRDEQFALMQHNLSNDIVLNVRKGKLEKLIDEHTEYDELDDELRYRKYSLIMDNNHIYMFSILEPKSIESTDEIQLNETKTYR